MAEAVERLLEGMVPAIEHLLSRGVVNRDEVRALVTRRRDFEYAILKRAAEERDWVRYLEWEFALEALRKRRMQAAGITRHVDADFAGLRHIHRIFDRALRKFRFQERWWLAWHDFSARVNSRKTAERVLARGLALLPRSEALWLAAAAWHFNHEQDPAVARALLQRAVRLNSHSPALWTALFQFECAYMMRMRGRRYVQGLDTLVMHGADGQEAALLAKNAMSGLDGAGGAEVEADDAGALSAKRDDPTVADGGEYAAAVAASARGEGSGSRVTPEAVMAGMVPIRVHDAAVEATGGAVAFRLGLLDVAESFHDELGRALAAEAGGGGGGGDETFVPAAPAFPVVISHILSGLASAAPTDPAAWRAIAGTPLRRAGEVARQWLKWSGVTVADLTSKGGKRGRARDDAAEVAAMEDADLFALDTRGSESADGEHKAEGAGDGAGAVKPAASVHHATPSASAHAVLGDALHTLAAGEHGDLATALASGAVDDCVTDGLRQVLTRACPPSHALLAVDHDPAPQDTHALSLPREPGLAPLWHVVPTAETPTPTPAAAAAPAPATGRKRKRAPATASREAEGASDRDTAPAFDAGIVAWPGGQVDTRGVAADSRIAAACTSAAATGVVDSVARGFEEAVASLSTVLRASPATLAPVAVQLHQAALAVPIPRTAGSATFRGRVLRSLVSLAQMPDVAAVAQADVIAPAVAAALRLGDLPAALGLLSQAIAVAPPATAAAIHLVKLRVLAALEAACRSVQPQRLPAAVAGAISSWGLPAPRVAGETATAAAQPVAYPVTASAAGAAIRLVGTSPGFAAVHAALIAALVGVSCPSEAAATLATRSLTTLSTLPAPPGAMDDARTALGAALLASGASHEPLRAFLAATAHAGWPVFQALLAAAEGLADDGHALGAVATAATAAHPHQTRGWVALYAAAKRQVAARGGVAPRAAASRQVAAPGDVYTAAVRALGSALPAATRGATLVAEFVETISRGR